MVSAKGVGVPDDALSPYPHPDRARHARCAAWAIENGLGDMVAWESICTGRTTVTVDARGRETIHLASVLEAYRVVYGNRRSRPKRRGRRAAAVTPALAPQDPPPGRLF